MRRGSTRGKYTKDNQRRETPVFSPDADLAERVVGQIDVANARVLHEALADHEACSRVEGVACEA